MHEMDLIPNAYRALRAQRRRQRSWALGVALLVLAAVGARLWIERGLAQERAWKAQWQPLQDKARAERTELTELQASIAQASAPTASSPTSAPVAPVGLLPSVLAALPATGLRLTAATLEATSGEAAGLNLQGQTVDEATLGQAVGLLRSHPQVTQVQLLGVKPEGAPGATSQRFEMLVRVVTRPAAPAASSGERP